MFCFLKSNSVVVTGEAGYFSLSVAAKLVILRTLVDNAVETRGVHDELARVVDVSCARVQWALSHDDALTLVSPSLTLVVRVGGSRGQDRAVARQTRGVACNQRSKESRTASSDGGRGRHWQLWVHERGVAI